MNRLIAGALALGLTTGLAQAASHADEVTLQLKWVTQAQFAGYYVAKDKGFYEDEGLNVIIKPGGPDIAPEQIIAGDGADVITTWMAAGLAARDSTGQHCPAVQNWRFASQLLEVHRC